MLNNAIHTILYDEISKLKISDLKEFGFLEQGQILKGTLSWNRNGIVKHNLSIKSNTAKEQPYIEFIYNYKNELKNYRIHLTKIGSNLNKGEIWYFICPVTRKRCRNLYLNNGLFSHREAFRGIYESQTRSKELRNLEKKYGPYFREDKLYEELNKKYFKTHYNGKPTKRYVKIMEQLKKAESVSWQDFQNEW